jgi:hypothetical protein
VSVIAEDFARPTGATRPVHFGLDLESAVAAIRRFANDVEAGTVLIGSVTQSAKAEPEDFVLNTLSIEYTLRRA